jgi:hypothetical protein
MICPSCFDSQFRLSHLRKADIFPLFALRYPVRCITCSHRMYGGPLFALHLWQRRRSKHHTLANGQAGSGRS